MRLLSWNIKWGGGERIPAILDRIREHQADIAVLSEYKQDTDGEALVAGLRQLGFDHACGSSPAVGRLGVLIAARDPVAVGPGFGFQENIEGWHFVDGAVGELRILGTYMPWDDRKIPYWGMVHAYARAHESHPTVLIGDFNTAGYAIDGSGEALKQSASMRELDALGFYDAWRVANPGIREFTWGNGRDGSQRLDYAFISRAIDKRRVTARHSHFERLEGISDHSVLLVDIEPLQ